MPCLQVSSKPCPPCKSHSANNPLAISKRSKKIPTMDPSTVFVPSDDENPENNEASKRNKEDDATCEGEQLQDLTSEYDDESPDAVVEVVGTNRGDGTRHCTAHEACGKSCTIGSLIYLQKEGVGKAMTVFDLVALL